MSETPRITQAHTSEEAEGGLFGVPIRSLLWLMPLLIVAGLLFLSMARRMGVVPAGLRTLLPVLLLFILVRHILGGTPFGFILDQWVSVFSKANASPTTKAGSVAGRILTSMPDGYVEDGLIVFGGLQGQVSAGFWIDLPDLNNASATERNRTQDIWSAIWRLLPEHWSCQLLTLEDNKHLHSQLLKYAEATKGSRSPVAKRLRDTNFVRLWHQVESGELRQRRLVLFVGYAHSPGLDDSAVRLSVAQKAIRDWSITIKHLLESNGGRMSPLESSDILRLWAETLNPSIRRARNYEPAAQYAPHCSLLENFWASEFLDSPDGGFLLDGVLHLALSMKRLPAKSFPGITQCLTRLDIPSMTLCLQIRRLSKNEVLQRAQAKLERVHRQQLEKPNPRLAVSQQQLVSKIERLAAQGVVPMEVELIAIIRANSPDELKNRAAAVKEAIQRMQEAQSFEASLSRSSQNLFSKCLPGWMWSSHRGYRHYLEDPTAADLVPWVSSFAGHPGPADSLFPGSDGGLVNVVTSVGRGMKSTPQHTVVLGSTGTGKSEAVTKLLIETTDAVVFTAIVESGRSQIAFTRAHNAEPLTFESNGTQTINFLSTHGRPRCAFYLSSTVAIIARMIGIPDSHTKAMLQNAIISRELERITSDHAEDYLHRLDSQRKDALLRQGAAIHRRMDGDKVSFIDAFDAFRLEMSEAPVAIAHELSQFDAFKLQEYEVHPKSHLKDLLFSILEESEQLTLSALREAFELADEVECRQFAVALDRYCRGKDCGVIFDGATNVKLSESVIHYELESISNAASDLQSIVGFAAINLIRAKCQSIPRTFRKRVVIDEIARFLSFPGAEAIVQELFEGFRKYNTQIIIIGQQYAQIADSQIKSAIVGNTSAWLIFDTGDWRDVERLVTDLKLPSLAQESISHFTKPNSEKEGTYSEFLYVHSLDNRHLCGSARYFMIPL